MQLYICFLFFVLKTSNIFITSQIHNFLYDGWTLVFRCFITFVHILFFLKYILKFIIYSEMFEAAQIFFFQNSCRNGVSFISNTLLCRFRDLPAKSNLNSTSQEVFLKFNVILVSFLKVSKFLLVKFKIKCFQ